MPTRDILRGDCIMADTADKTPVFHDMICIVYDLSTSHSASAGLGDRSTR